MHSALDSVFSEEIGSYVNINITIGFREDVKRLGIDYFQLGSCVCVFHFLSPFHRVS